MSKPMASTVLSALGGEWFIDWNTPIPAGSASIRARRSRRQVIVSGVRSGERF
jgi:hypothetical protein